MNGCTRLLCLGLAALLLPFACTSEPTPTDATAAGERPQAARSQAAPSQPAAADESPASAEERPRVRFPPTGEIVEISQDAVTLDVLEPDNRGVAIAGRRTFAINADTRVGVLEVISEVESPLRTRQEFAPRPAELDVLDVGDRVIYEPRDDNTLTRLHLIPPEFYWGD